MFQELKINGTTLPRPDGDLEFSSVKVKTEYETEAGFERACKCVESIEGGIEAIVFHDKMKGCYKDLVRRLGAHYNVPIYKHQRIRSPETMEFAVK